MKKEKIYKEIMKDPNVHPLAKKYITAVKEIRDIRIADERKEKEKEMDEWFENLTILQQADIAYNFWDGASYEEKLEEYTLE